jgi:23S rRNA pseudouridine1911/1915/1917 synthase
MNPDIIFEDEFVLVINKPAGWVTTSAATTIGQKTVQGWLAENYYFPIFELAQCRNGIVHRLDKDTSGILLIAKQFESFTDLQKQFSDRVIQKEYVALLHGKLRTPAGTVKAEVGRLPWNRERFGIMPGGRASETSYQLIQEYVKDKQIYSFVAFQPKTGRTHQIRIHAKFLGNPIVSDMFYAGRKTSRRDMEWCPRLFLHAAKITFNHPATKNEMTLVAPLPKDLADVIKTFSS